MGWVEEATVEKEDRGLGEGNGGEVEDAVDVDILHGNPSMSETLWVCGEAV